MLGVDIVQSHLIPQLVSVFEIISAAKKYHALSNSVMRCELILLNVLGYFLVGSLKSLDFPYREFPSMYALLSMKVKPGNATTDHKDKRLVNCLLSVFISF